MGVRRSATLVLAVGTALGASAGTAGPALAAERVVLISRDGVRPQVLQAEPGDTVRFVNDDPTFAYRAQSTAGPWRFDSGPTTLLEGDFVVPSPLTAAGTYAFRVAQDPPFAGSVVVGTAGATAGPTAGPTAPAPVAPSSAAGTDPGAPPAAPAVPGPLPGPQRSRELGLALAVGAVLLAGAASLLLRLLLALPTPGPGGLGAAGGGTSRW